MMPQITGLNNYKERFYWYLGLCMMGYIYRFNLIVVTLLLFLTFWLLTADIHHAMVSIT